MKKSVFWAIAITMFAVLGFSPNEVEKKWTVLFNGKDLSNWDTYIGAEFNGGEWDEWTKGPRLGLNNDPDGLFKVDVLEGEPVIHVSGKRFGGLSTHQEFENYHLQLQFKWGSHKYAPKENSPRDSGLLYHAVGEHGADSGFWMRSQEFQIQEGDTGDYWGCAGATFDVPVKMEGTSFIYDPEGELLHFSPAIERGRHAVKSIDAEKPSGEWNTIDLYCLDGIAIHVINGQKNMVLYNSSQIDKDGQEIPLTKGKIQLQSEGAEIYFKNIQIRPLKKLPGRYLK
ncbi:3-keto-disaccharide hydrolase [Flagellimonas sp.]|uniref:3-keto-disaccharide hydrolase n=1 Tax=Flagellimonas sp. TaxID=2058762 RepID=UPI003BAEEC32